MSLQFWKHFTAAGMVVAMLMLIIQPASAQEQRGKIQGTVTDQNGLAIAGATVILESDSLISGSMITETSDKGRYRFVLLPIGKYSVKVTAENYKEFTQTDIALGIGATLVVNPVMTMADFTGVVEIEYEPPLIDLTRTTVSTTLTSELLSTLPKPSMALDTLKMTPLGQGTSIAGGASDAGNSYQIDGVDVSDPEAGSAWMMTDYSIADEIEIITAAGTTADIGGFTGGAVNIVTRSGGNEFSGSVSMDYYDESFVGTNIDDESLQETNTRSYFTGMINGNIGGPVVKDRVWFFANYTSRILKTRYGGLANRYDMPNALAKVTAQLTDNIMLSTVYHYTDIKMDGRGAAYNKSEDTLLDQRTPNHAYGINLDWVIDDDNILRTKYSGFAGTLELEPRGSGAYYYDIIEDYGYGNAQYWLDSDRSKNTLRSDFTHYADDLMGQHEMKFGVEYDTGESTDDMHLEYISVMYGIPLARVAYEPDSYSLEKYHSLNLYGADSWSLGKHLTLNVGLRYERQTNVIPDQELSDGTTVSGIDDVHTFNNIAPRLGMTWRLTESGDHLLRASWGMYYEAMNTYLFHELNPAAPTLYTQIWTGASWYTIAASSTDDYALDPDISAFYTDAFTIGYEGQIFRDVVVGVDYIRTRTHDIIVNVDQGRTYEPYTFSLDGTNYTVYNYAGGDYEYLITNADDDELYSHYDAVTFSLKKRFSNNFQTQTFLTLSKLEGTAAESATNASDSGLVTGDLGYYSNPNYQINAAGLLYNHRPWSIKSTGTYIFPADFMASWYVTYSAGRRWTPILSYSDSNLTEGSVTILAEKRGSRALDPMFNADIRLMKIFTLNPIRLELALDIYNIFNNAAVISVDQYVQSSTFGEAVTVQPPRTLQLGLKLSF